MNRLESRCHETILLVDDEPHLRGMLYTLLTSKKYNVIQAVNGLDALEKFKHNPHGVDLVLTDIVMPRMDGVTSAQEMRSINPAVKILFMSGYLADRPQPESNLMIKPFHPVQLLQTIRTILDDQTIS